MMHTTISRILVSAALGAALPAAASVDASTSAVPIPDRSGAVFSPRTGWPKVFVADGDGARLVACDAALVRAAAGSRIRVSCGVDPDVTFEEGAFHLAVGSKPVRLIASELVIVSNARIEAAKIGEKWFFRFTADGDAASVMLGDGTKLLPGKLYDFTPPASETSADAPSPTFEELLRRASPPARSRAALVPKRVERIARAEKKQAAGASADGDVEIESIEVEVGCIEVCVD